MARHSTSPQIWHRPGTQPSRDRTTEHRQSLSCARQDPRTRIHSPGKAGSADVLHRCHPKPLPVECWVRQRATHDRLPHALFVSRGVRADRVLQQDDHLVSIWPSGEPGESASQCGDAATSGSAVEPGISRLTLAGRPDEPCPPGRNTISQIPPNTRTAPIRSVGWEPSSELLTWSFSGAPLRNRTVDLLLTMHAGFVRWRRVRVGLPQFRGKPASGYVALGLP